MSKSEVRRIREELEALEPEFKDGLRKQRIAGYYLVTAIAFHGVSLWAIFFSDNDPVFWSSIIGVLLSFIMHRSYAIEGNEQMDALEEKVDKIFYEYIHTVIKERLEDGKG